MQRVYSSFGNVPTNVKPEGKGSQATHGNLTVTFIPRAGILIIILIFQLQRAVEK